MATTKIKQLESFDSGSNYKFEDKRLDKTIPRSLFDKSHKNIGTMAETGVIMPLALIPTIPNESNDISINILLRALPTVVPLESRQRLYVYAFYNRMGDLWKNFNTFMKKGYNGNYDGTIPVLKNSKNTAVPYNNNIIQQRNESTYNSTWETNKSIQATSMGESLGLPHSYNYTSKTINGVTVYGYENTTDLKKFVEHDGTEEKISALPFMMLLRIWRDYFTNKNYWIDDRVILPHDDEDFRLNDDGELVSAKNENANIRFDISSKVRDITISESGGNKYYYFGLPYHEFPKDRFTSALPFMQRGDTPTLEKNFPILNQGGKLQVFKSDGTLRNDMNVYKPYPVSMNQLGLTASEASSFNYNGQHGFVFDNEDESGTQIESGDYLGISGLGQTIKLTITMNELRKLAIEQSELEAMARTDGSYREFGLTFFGKVSKNAEDHKSVYIGGIYQEIKYTEVVQTSESGNTPMGSYTGHSTGLKSGYLGHIDTDDYGYIMILACVMPDVIYSEGLQNHWTNLKQSQFYLPQRAKLGMTPLLKKEVRFNYATTEDAQTENNNLFAYQNIFDELRYIPNRVSGYMADMFRKDWSPYTQSRIIADTPVWGREFALASKNNVRNDYLVAPNEPPFTFDCGISIRCVAPIPYKPIPANLTGL